MIRLLDGMRSGYFRLPGRFKAAISPILRVVPVSIQYGGTYKKVRNDIARSETDANFVHDYQSSALREILTLAQRRSRHFSCRLGANFDPSRFDVADLPSLPILTKAEVTEDADALLVADPGNFDVKFTSGSSGRPPTKIFLDCRLRVREIAFLHHIWSRIGYRLGDGRAVLRDYGGNVASPDNTWRYDSALRELWMSPFHLTEATMDHYLELFHKFRVRYLYGIPSAISILAEHGLKREWKAPKSLRGIMPASETLFDHQRKIMHECFGVPIVAHYGMSERVAIAGEVIKRPGTYEFEPLYGLAEIVNDAGEPIRVPGQRGRLVSTGFFSRSMALIRYEIGDRATLVENATHENCYRLRVCDIRSRWNQEFVMGRNGERISVINLDQENHFGFIKEYQYAQSVPGEVVMRIVPCGGVSQEELEALMKPTRVHVKGVIDLKLEIVPSIPVGLTGKRAFVDQRIPSMND